MSKRNPSINDLKAKAGAKYGYQRAEGERQLKQLKRDARRKEELARHLARQQEQAAYRAAHPELFPPATPRQQRAPGIFVSFMNGFMSGDQVQEVFDQLDEPSKKLLAVGGAALEEIAEGDYAQAPVVS